MPPRHPVNIEEAAGRSLLESIIGLSFRFISVVEGNTLWRDRQRREFACRRSNRHGLPCLSLIRSRSIAAKFFVVSESGSSGDCSASAGSCE